MNGPGSAPALVRDEAGPTSDEGRNVVLSQPTEYDPVSRRSRRSPVSRRSPGSSRGARAVAAPDTGGPLPPPPGLSRADARLLEGIAVGATTGELAAALHLSRSGVEYRLAAMVRRLAVANRSALVARAYSLGLLTVGTWPPRVPVAAVTDPGGQDPAGTPIAARSPFRSDTASLR